MRKIGILTLLLTISLSCNGKKFKKECSYMPEDELNFYIECIDSSEECEKLKIEITVKIENISKEQILLTELATGRKYKLYSSIPLPIITGEQYKIKYFYQIGGPTCLSHKLFEIYSETEEKIFLGMTNNPLPEFPVLPGGIIMEEMWGECARSDEFGNFGLKFICGEKTVLLYQSETGSLICNNNSYDIHVNRAEGMKEEPECTVENPCPTDLCPPIYSFYIVKK